MRFEVVSWRRRRQQQQDAKGSREPFLQIQATIIRTSASSLPAAQSCQKRQNMLRRAWPRCDHCRRRAGGEREQKCASGETPMSASKASLLLNDSYWKSSHGSDRCHPRTADVWPRRSGWTQAAKVWTLGACVNISPAIFSFWYLKGRKDRRNWLKRAHRQVMFLKTHAHKTDHRVMEGS